MEGADCAALDPRSNPTEKHLTRGIVDVMQQIFSRQDALLSKRRSEKAAATDHEVRNEFVDCYCPEHRSCATGA